MNTNQTNTVAPAVKCYDNTYQICTTLGAYARANAPDEKSSYKACRVVSSHSHMLPRDMLSALSRVFNMLSERSWDKAVDSGNAYAKHQPRSAFYRRLADWANACYDLEKETPVIKDAEDDSDPYVKPVEFYKHSGIVRNPPNNMPSPKADQVEHALTQLKTRLTLAGFGERRIDLAAALFRSVVLERPIGATVLDVLERFGDEASELSWEGDYDDARFWDACVTISDDLRGKLAADQLRKASTITVPDRMWEVDGDPDRALYRTEKEAMRVTRKLFPDEFVTLRYARLRRRNVKTFK